MDDETFLKQFEPTTWPKAEGHHGQHTKVAYLYLRRYPLEPALVRISEDIKASNKAQGVEPDPIPLPHSRKRMENRWR